MRLISEYEPPKRMMIDVESLFDCDTCYHNQNGQCNTSCDAGESYRPAMSKLEIIEAEPVRHGRWNFTSCSLCGKSFLDYAEADCDRSIYLDLPNYCPNCGAKMDGKENQ